MEGRNKLSKRRKKELTEGRGKWDKEQEKKDRKRKKKC